MNVGWQSMITWGVFPKIILTLNCFGNLLALGNAPLVDRAQEGSS